MEKGEQRTALRHTGEQGHWVCESRVDVLECDTRALAVQITLKLENWERIRAARRQAI